METRTAAEYGMQGAGTSCDASDRKPSACDDAARACTRAAERWGAQEAGAFATTVESEGGLAACELVIIKFKFKFKFKFHAPSHGIGGLWRR